MFIGRRNEIVMLSDEVNVLLVAVFVGRCFHRLRPHRAAGPSLNPEGICFHTLSQPARSANSRYSVARLTLRICAAMTLSPPTFSRTRRA